ncbi:MAG: GNAT family N-acetyltransferase [Acholeplasmataceae bacterium]|nr:GNAT family N-acetyltransferase [Acholeplasmataceae bacterium]MDD4203873.1 GNAT family N-acetyltransferase [Acholeplasmataceae bacterium]MDD4468358.1 GNAT family N-acetyltransferase [Acholeplasmataceae bacterium]MDD4823650.1 GNAT family N-acetyltransferase [Acholeplasmataceae bacterium]
MFKRVTIIEDVTRLTSLANEIWREAYLEILSSDQIDYMLEQYLSVSAIKSQLENSTTFYLIYKNDQCVGFFSYNLKDVVFLSKLYVKKNFRLQGHAKRVINYLKSYVRPIELTVNIHNQKAIKSYEKLGFKIIEPMKTAIGNGYYMDDFLMRYDQ